MRHVFHRSMLSAIVLVALVASGAGMTLSSTPAAHAAAGKACTNAAVTYIVGPRTVQQANGVPSNATPIRPGALPFGGLSGFLVLNAYPPCGGPTGSFNVHGTAPIRPYPVPYAGGASTKGRATAVLMTATTVLTTTGTFAPDPAHPTDPTHVVVSGTVTYGRYQFGGPLPQTPKRGFACSLKTCPMRTVVVRTVSFANIPGSLRLQGTLLVLSFAPPSTPAAIVLQGQRAG